MAMPTGARDAEAFKLARELRAEGESLATIARRVGKAYSTVQRWTKDVRPDLARSPRDAAEIRSSRVTASAAVVGEIERRSAGAPCGAPSCADPECPIEPGACHCGCGRRAPLAQANEVDRLYVRGRPLLYVRGHNGRGATVMAVDQGATLRAARVEAGLTMRQLSLAAGLHENAVSSLERLHGFRVQEAGARRIADMLGRDFDELFARQVVVLPDANGYYRTRTRDPVPRSERYDGRHFVERAREQAAEIHERGLWTLADQEKDLLVARSQFGADGPTVRLDDLTDLRGRPRLAAEPRRRSDTREIVGTGR